MSSSNSRTFNTSQQMDICLAELRESGQIPKLLLHSCCGPCSSYVLEYLAPCFCITVYYYNPNLDRLEEYEHRRDEQIRLIREINYPNPVSFIDGDYVHSLYCERIKGLEKEPEGGLRCEACFRLRLEKTAEMAAGMGFDYFATTLTVSPHKNAPLINEIGEKAGETFGIAYLPSDFKKKNGYLRSIELAKEHTLYRQNYCGCEFSKDTLNA